MNLGYTTAGSSPQRSLSSEGLHSPKQHTHHREAYLITGLKGRQRFVGILSDARRMNLLLLLLICVFESEMLAGQSFASRCNFRVIWCEIVMDEERSI